MVLCGKAFHDTLRRAVFSWQSIDGWMGVDAVVM
jgi:hypothetical protein